MSNNPYNAPNQAGAQQPMRPIGIRSVCIKRVDVMSCGIMMGALYLIIGLVVGGIMFLITIAGVAVGAGAGGGEAVLGGLIGGIGAIIIMPLIYGAMGFIGGIIGAVLYNLVAGVAGGIRMDLEG